jgi:hypothetical protein
MSLSHIHQCPVCGNDIDESEMHEGRVTCEMCNAELYFDFSTNELKEVPKQNAAPVQNTPSNQNEVKQSDSAPSGKRYFVHCDDSQTDTFLDDPEAKYDKAANTFFCKGCKKTHTIDGFFFAIQEKAESSGVNTTAADKSKNIASLTGEAQKAVDVKVLKSNMEGTHVDLICDMDNKVFSIPESGGVIGRYGTIDPDFFQHFSTISGEHCRIFKNEYGKWMLEHLSHTNDTEYDGTVMKHGIPLVLSDGKKIRLARFLTFTVHIY